MKHALHRAELQVLYSRVGTDEANLDRLIDQPDDEMAQDRSEAVEDVSAEAKCDVDGK